MEINPPPPNPPKPSIFESTVRTCLGACRRVLKAESFTLRGDGVCDECAEKERAEAKELAKQNRAAELMDQVLIVGGEEEGLPKVEKLIGGMLGSFGGMEGFIKYWKESLDEVKERGVTTGFLARLENFVKFVFTANEYVRQDNVDQMTLEQIQDAKKQMFLEQMMESLQDDEKAQVIRKMLQEQGLLDPELGKIE